MLAQGLPYFAMLCVASSFQTPGGDTAELLEVAHREVRAEPEVAQDPLLVLRELEAVDREALTPCLGCLPRSHVLGLGGLDEAHVLE
eukprot:12945114-Alexandrium_andersonii.AAC.1